jgi:uncharacterized membrane protein YczE
MKMRVSKAKYLVYVFGIFILTLGIAFTNGVHHQLLILKKTIPYN